MTKSKKMQAFDVIHNGKVIDTIFYGSGIKISADEVRKSLINHDGYPSDIKIQKRK